MTDDELIAALGRRANMMLTAGWPKGAALIHETIARIRQTAAYEELLAACQALSEYQRRYGINAEDPEGMPGNVLYRFEAMKVVNQARAAIAKAQAHLTKEPAP